MACRTMDGRRHSGGGLQRPRIHWDAVAGFHSGGNGYHSAGRHSQSNRGGRHSGTVPDATADRNTLACPGSNAQSNCESSSATRGHTHADAHSCNTNGAREHGDGDGSAPDADRNAGCDHTGPVAYRDASTGGGAHCHPNACG